MNRSKRFVFMALKMILGDKFNQTPKIQEAIAAEDSHFVLYMISR